MTMRLLTWLSSWGRNARGRISRRPKVCLSDTGLTAHLAGFTGGQARAVGGREFYGALVESFVVLELVKQRGWSRQPFDLFHFRDHDGLEVDVVVELDDGRLLAIEVKSGQTVTEKAWAGIDKFARRFPERDVTGIVLHGSSQVAHLRDRLHVLPITALWEHGPPLRAS